MKTFARAAFVAVFATSIVALPAHSIPNEDYKRTIQMVEGSDVTQFTLTPVRAGGQVNAIWVSNGDNVVPEPTPKSDTDKKITSLKNTIEMMRERFNNATLNFEARIKELERKVAGMQKQITILHAKKVNK
jgi:hypothetical protein